MSRPYLIPLIIALIITLSISVNGLFQQPANTFANLLRWKSGGLRFLREIKEYGRKQLPDMTPLHGQEFDFIVVGAGSAGAAIASRLTEIPELKVLLIEAGGEETLAMDIPLMALFLQFDQKINWDYYTDFSDDYCRGSVYGQCRASFGKVMGGASTTNFMIATRGNRHDYNEWAEITGDSNWSYDGMLPYFKKLETFNLKYAAVNHSYHGFEGPVRIVNPPYFSELGTAFVRAGEEMGFPPVDWNGEKQTGFSYMQTNQAHGERVSSNRAYLLPAKGRQNLFLTMNSEVSRVLIDPKNKTAYAVEFQKNGRRIQVRCRKEIIISAGAVASPKILMLSGIGPAKHLRDFNINVLQDLPVGENLMDHISYGGLIFNVNESQSIVIPELLNLNNRAVDDYLFRRTGPLAGTGVEGLGLINTDDFNAENETPNMELLFSIATSNSGDLAHKALSIDSDFFRKYAADQLHKHAYLIFPILMKPKSRGKILLRSRNPSDKPRIIANYFSHPDDVRVAILGIRKAIEVSKTRSMRKFDAQMHNRTIPGCENYVKDSDEYWECALRTITATFWHHSGTCKMGRIDDPTAVVNTKLQVKGIKRLRVADASIIPIIPAAHLNIPTMAIGEKFADILKMDWGYI